MMTSENTVVVVNIISYVIIVMEKLMRKHIRLFVAIINLPHNIA